MALPSSGSISVAQVAAELGLSLPLDLNDSRVRALAGKPTGNVTLPNDFWGKANAKISIGGNFSPQNSGGFGGQRFDQGQFVVYREPTTLPQPTSHAWDYVDYGGGLVMLGGTSGSSLTLRGPSYNPDSFNQTYQVLVSCTVVINGQSLYGEGMFYYTTGDFA